MTLVEALRQSAVQLTDVDDTPDKLAMVRPLLPREPLTAAFLDEALAPVPHAISRISVINLLACLDRREIADYAATMLAPESDPFNRYLLASALIRCRDERGFDELKRLHLESLDKAPGEQPPVPGHFLYSALESLGKGSEKADEIRFWMSEQINARKFLADPAHGRRVGDRVFSVGLRDGRICGESAAYRDGPLLNALSFLWNADAEKFVVLLEHRSRWKKRDISLTYSEASRGKVPEGKVLAAYGDEWKILLERSLFEEVAVVFGETAIGLLGKAGTPVPDGIEARLKALRARI